MTGRLLVVGVGNRDRGDDAVGPVVCDRLDRRAHPAIDTRVVETGGVELLHAWCADDEVVLVDAAAPAGRPGRITRIDPIDDTFGDAFGSATSTWSSHAVDVASWVELGRVVGMLPRRLELLAVEGSEFRHGTALTDAVDRAADDVVSRIAALADNRLIER